ncbi:hypothetical protein Hanom_Chr04g00336001 [Helianthus anomalus]
MPSSYPGRHMPLPRLEPGTSGKRWVSVANWATPVKIIKCKQFMAFKLIYIFLHPLFYSPVPCFMQFRYSCCP